MLYELAIRDLGVIDDVSLVLGPGLTAFTGETGAGKTMVVGAISLLVGGRADGSAVRPDAEEAVVEGRFLRGDDEVVVRRVVPRDGRSRAYIDGRLATVSALAELGAGLIDLHGQHEHQTLLSAGVQRRALDRFGQIDLGPWLEARADLAAIDAALADLGGDERARARELDLYRFQVEELHRAGLEDPDEEAVLARDEAVLADAVAHREAAVAAHDAVLGDAAARDLVARAGAAVAGRSPFAALADRLAAVAAELTDVAEELRAAGEAIEEDPGRLAELRARRQLLRELRRKYGATLADVIAYQVEAEARLADLVGHDERAAALDRRRAAAEDRLAAAAAALRAARAAAAPRLGKAVGRHLAELAMAKARFAVAVDGDAGEDVRLLLAANPGASLAPLAKVASGGELARAMLALRLVLTEGPPTMVFDEVDAGIGGEAALAVGRALAELGRERQVLLVTHLPQVAAFADHQVGIAKQVTAKRTRSTVAALSGEDRVVELSRMLSGSPTSSTARDHAAELLASAARDRGR